MSFVMHTVRWATQHQIEGWAWTEGPARVWGLDNLDRYSRFDVRRVGRNASVFVAPDATTHDTMRDLFAHFRLRMCDCERQTDQLHHLRNVLTLMANEIHRSDFTSFIEKGFGGNRAFGEHYLNWLESEKFTGCIGRTIAEVSLSDEGLCAMRMLDMTAPGSNIDTSPAGALDRFNAEFPGRR